MRRNLILFIVIALLLATLVTVSVACTPKENLPEHNQSSGSTSGEEIPSGTKPEDNLSSGSTSGDNQTSGSASDEDKPITEKWEEKFGVDYRVDVFSQSDIEALSRELELNIVYLVQYCDKDDDGRHSLGWITMFESETDAEKYYDMQIEELELSSDSEDVVERDGKAVFYGTPDGLKIFREVK